MSFSRAQQRRLESRELRRITDEIRGRLSTGKPLFWRQRIKLLMAWGNIGYSASVRYLQQVEGIYRRTKGPILECGSGATTLLLVLLAEQHDRPVWTFEHHGEWSAHVADVLAKLELRQVKVCHTPLQCYGEYEWYTLPDLALPTNFGMVICDGPPGTIRGGRYGLFPVMGRRLDSECRILLDDTHRKAEQALIRRWENERKLWSNAIGVFGSCTELALA